MVDLLRHTAGLTYGFQERTPVDAAYRKARIDDFDADYTMDSFIADLAKMPLQFDPGAHWNYSMATDVLGAVIERIEGKPFRSEEHTSELQSLMRISYAVFCLKKKNI